MKNKRYFASIILIILIVVVSMFAGCKDKEMSEKDLSQKVDELNETIHIDWGQIRPLTVNNNIIITSGEKTLIQYDKKYTILEDNTGYMLSSTIFGEEDDGELNNQQEVYYHQNQLSIKYSDSEGEFTRQYNSTFSAFEEMISGGANDVFSYNYVYDYFENVEYQEFETSMNIMFTLSNSHINDFLGQEVESISNFTISFILYYNIDKIEVELEYDTAENGVDAHVKANCIAEQVGNIDIPEWV